MIDINNKECRYIQTPDGLAQIDFYIAGNKAGGQIERVMVWLGECSNPKDHYFRPHIIYDVSECEEIDGD